MSRVGKPDSKVMDLKTMHELYLDAGSGCFDRILTLGKREYV